ncbi:MULTISPECIES: acetyl-CoA carboxylase biotin carboxyl carrier protein [unclassified Nesterenkonia]|uniref:acetyl-CoA carboxylase biotin carboxyl carrier protein n=1 Tax=unclassified Nesterenkonia TaxID=2629769 RepID=UPI001F4C6CD3|nr:MULTISPECIES: acetyl-CoA carboxylase biotin carboxyl carrier protein [unclassified Nesterenkonia]MCH8559254.1 acetyl-CoA carboxylase biotin carboxyl carrier protein [Nesterenkonia sp. DZ6]MCH8571599.1 acetyl-CoA carboxylase biotin carboxyl carrier protein [Nesterenkonia sp. AY15]
MALNQPDIRELKSLVDWVNTTPDVRELSIKYGDVELFVSRNGHAPSGVPAAAPAPSPTPEQSPTTAAQPPEATAPTPASVPANGAASLAAGAPAAAAEDEVTIAAPMVGTFYSAPNPGAPAFVNVGDRVSADSVLCILEVMKLMNNVEAKVDGVVTEILVENNEAVEFGQPLMVIKRDS